MYLTLNEHYQSRFGCKVYKLALDAGFSCPNRDGTIGAGGCIFCSGAGSGEFAAKPCGSIASQMEQARRRVEAKNKDGKYIAYFQAFTGTYAPLSVLEDLYRQAMAPVDIVALAVATRPDCLPPETVSLLAELNRHKPVYVELGLQTVHPESVAYIRRGYENAVYLDAVRRLKAVGIHVVTHIILGLPGETADMAAETTRQAVAAGTDGVKFHLLHVLRGTDLALDYAAGRFRCLDLPSYARWLRLCLAQLPPDIVVHRITGDGAKRDLVAPLWSADKKKVQNYLKKFLQTEESIMDAHVAARNKLLAKKIMKGLAARNMTGYYAENRQEALRLALELLPEGCSVAWGGSATISQIGLKEAVCCGNYTVYDRDGASTLQQRHQQELNAFDADCYLCSSNAITEDGILVNMDGNSNRVACICYGPRKVVMVVGMNKVCKDVPSAVSRVRNAAAPCNAQRFSIETPCIKTGSCSDCLSPDTICCQMLITRFSRHPQRIHVILVNDTLGY